jgi:hypothetical protein
MNDIYKKERTYACYLLWLFNIILMSSAFLGVKSCSQLRVNRRLAGTCCLHLQGKRIGRARKQRDSKWQATTSLATRFHAGFLLGLFFDLENGSNMFFRNVGLLSTYYSVLCLKRKNSSQPSLWETQILQHYFEFLNRIFNFFYTFTCFIVLFLLIYSQISKFIFLCKRKRVI